MQIMEIKNVKIENADFGNYSGATAGQRSTSMATGGTSTAPRCTSSGLAVRSSSAPASTASST